MTAERKQEVRAMTQEERLDRLIRGLLAERGEDLGLPRGYGEKRRLLRGLMNVRLPGPAAPEWLRLQDEFLQAEAAEKGIVEGMELPAVPLDPRLVLWRGDITRLRADAIVNAANSALLGCFVPCHGCIDNAIHSAAGLELREACRELMDAQGRAEPAGRAKVTPGFALPARYVIHTVGPIVTGKEPTDGEKYLLQSCYRSCLEAAAGAGCRSMAFCCISTGEFHFPNREAAELAVRTVREELPRYPKLERVIFDVFGTADETIYRELLGTA